MISNEHPNDDGYLSVYLGPAASTQSTSDAGNDLDSLTNMNLTHFDFPASHHDQFAYSPYTPQHQYLPQTSFQFSQPTTPINAPNAFDFDQTMGMGGSYSPVMEHEAHSHSLWMNRDVPLIRLDTSFPVMGVSPAHLTGSSGTPSTFNTPVHGLRQFSPFTSSPTSPLPQLNDFQTSPTSPNTVQPNVWDLARAYPPSRGVPVPQKMYKPHTQSDRRRYVEEVELEPPIMFGLQGPAECGIPLRDALTGKYIRLTGRDDAMFRERGPSVSIRLKWPGYGNWSRQIPTKDFRSPPCPITRSKLAKNIARTVERFIKEKSRSPMDSDEDPRWKVGPGHITIDDLVLVGLQHVSKGSWQCHLRLNRPL